MEQSGRPSADSVTVESRESTGSDEHRRHRAPYSAHFFTLCTVRTFKKPERACKPGSVENGHVSGTPIARRLARPTRASNGADSSSALLGLAPGGVCRAGRVTTPAVRSYRTVSPLPEPGGFSILDFRFAILTCRVHFTLPPPCCGIRTRQNHVPPRLIRESRIGNPKSKIPRAIGGLFSVALSRSSRTVGVTHHRVLGSPDFPPRRRPCGSVGRPATTWACRRSGRSARSGFSIVSRADDDVGGSFAESLRARSHPCRPGQNFAVRPDCRRWSALMGADTLLRPPMGLRGRLPEIQSQNRRCDPAGLRRQSAQLWSQI